MTERCGRRAAAVAAGHTTGDVFVSNRVAVFGFDCLMFGLERLMRLPTLHGNITIVPLSPSVSIRRY